MLHEYCQNYLLIPRTLPFPDVHVSDLSVTSKLLPRARMEHRPHFNHDYTLLLVDNNAHSRHNHSLNRTHSGSKSLAYTSIIDNWIDDVESIAII